MARNVFHMRMATDSNVCIDVVIRDNAVMADDQAFEARNRIIDKMRAFLDIGIEEPGSWAGIGYGQFIHNPEGVHLA